MNRFSTRVLAFLLIFASSAAAQMGGASGGSDFNALQAEAYAYYREAAFYTRTGNTPVAGLALDKFIDGWSELVSRFGDDPPTEYAADDKWKATLDEILERASRGLDALDMDDAESASVAIDPIRGMLREMRERNGVVTYSDHVDALTAAMDVMVGYRRDIRELSNPADVEKIGKQADIVEALFATLQQEAPAQVAGDPEFKRMIAGAAESMGRLREGLRTGNARLFRIGSGELRSYERIMFLRYG